MSYSGLTCDVSSIEEEQKAKEVMTNNKEVCVELKRRTAADLKRKREVFEEAVALLRETEEGLGQMFRCEDDGKES